MISVTIETEIGAPAEVVYDYIADLTNNPHWQFGIASTKETSHPPVRVGSTYDQTMDRKGHVTSYKVTAIDPGRSITFESQSGAITPTTVTRTVQVLDESRCRVRVDLTVELRGWRLVPRPLVVRMIRRSIRSDYRTLKRRLESG